MLPPTLHLSGDKWCQPARPQHTHHAIGMPEVRLTLALPHKACSLAQEQLCINGTHHVLLVTAGCPTHSLTAGQITSAGVNALCWCSTGNSRKDAKSGRAESKACQYTCISKILLKRWRNSTCLQIEAAQRNKEVSLTGWTPVRNNGAQIYNTTQAEFLQFLENMSSGLVHFFICYYLP